MINQLIKSASMRNGQLEGKRATYTPSPTFCSTAFHKTPDEWARTFPVVSN